jgi:hypothetical protein
MHEIVSIFESIEAENGIDVCEKPAHDTPKSHFSPTQTPPKNPNSSSVWSKPGGVGGMDGVGGDSPVPITTMRNFLVQPWL